MYSINVLHVWNFSLSLSAVALRWYICTKTIQSLKLQFNCTIHSHARTHPCIHAVKMQKYYLCSNRTRLTLINWLYSTIIIVVRMNEFSRKLQINLFIWMNFIEWKFIENVYFNMLSMETPNSWSELQQWQLDFESIVEWNSAYRMLFDLIIESISSIEKISTFAFTFVYISDFNWLQILALENVRDDLKESGRQNLYPSNSIHCEYIRIFI